MNDIGDAMVDAGDWIRDAGDSSIQDAHAQDSGASECLQWDVSNFGIHASSFEVDIEDGSGNFRTLPEGWEPYGIPSGQTRYILVRRCTRRR
jgi:hypothetical protein